MNLEDELRNVDLNPPLTETIDAGEKAVIGEFLADMVQRNAKIWYCALWFENFFTNLISVFTETEKLVFKEEHSNLILTEILLLNCFIL